MSVAIVDARAKLAAVLAPVVDSDPDVQSAPVDAIVAPGLIIGWRPPMIDAWTVGTCAAYAHLFVMIVAERLDIATGYETIETQYQRIAQLLPPAGWGITGDSGPGGVEIGKTLYLACRVDVRCPVSV